jgi:hypothetical protein
VYLVAGVKVCVVWFVGVDVVVVVV